MQVCIATVSDTTHTIDSMDTDRKCSISSSPTAMKLYEITDHMYV